MTLLQPGVHFDIDDATYHADKLTDRPTLSSTLARVFLDGSPLHVWTAHPQMNPDFEPVEKKVFDIGRAAHREVLGRGGDYAAIPDHLLSADGGVRTKAAKEWVDDCRERGITPLKSDEVRKIRAMAEKIGPRLAEYGISLDPARSEVTVLAEIDDVMCRCRIDNAPTAPIRIPGIPTPRKVLIDLKTCESASPEACRRAVENYGLDFQACWYTEAWKAATGEDRDMLFVFEEKDAPHEVCVVHLLNEPGHSGDWFEDARAKAAVSRAMWRECLKTGNWPGRPVGIFTLSARPFYRQAWEDKASVMAVTSKPAADALRAAYEAQAPGAAAE